MTAAKMRHLTRDELSERLRIPEATVKKWRATGQGPRYIPVGRHVRYREQDVEAWERSRLVATVP